MASLFPSELEFDIGVSNIKYQIQEGMIQEDKGMEWHYRKMERVLKSPASANY